MFCPSCGEELEPDSQFCTKCGRPIKASASVQAPPPAQQPTVPNATTSKEPARKSLVPILVSVVAALVIVAAIAFIVLPKAQAPANSSTQEQPESSASTNDGSSSAIATAPEDSNSTSSSAESSGAAGASNSEASASGSEASGASTDQSTQAAAPVFTDAVASSELPPDQYTSYYGPLNVLDGDIKTGWNEGSDGDGTGEWIELQAGSPQTVTGVRIMAGYAKSEEVYGRNNRPTSVTITLSDGYTTQITLADKFASWNSTTFDGPHETTSMRITINAVNKGSKWNDAAITDVEAF